MPAVAALAAIVAALMALLIAYAIGYLGKVVARFLPANINLGAASVPIRSLVQATIDAALSGISEVFWDLTGAMVSFIGRPVLAFLAMIRELASMAVTFAAQLQWLTFNAIPQALNAAKVWAFARITALRAYVLTLYARAIAYAAREAGIVHAYAASLYHAAIAEAGRLYGLAKVYAHELVTVETAARVAADNAVKGYAAALVSTARADLSKAITAVEGEIHNAAGVTQAEVAAAIGAASTQITAAASTLVTQGIGALTSDVTAAVEGVFDGLIIDVGSLVDVIGTDLPDIGDLARAIPRAIPTDIAGAIGLSLTLDRVMVKYLERCGVPNCRNLGGLGHLLGDLLSAAGLAGLLAMLAEMIHDPEAAARATADDLGSVVSGAQNLISDLLGV